MSLSDTSRHRLIDSMTEPASRKEMKVLVLGLCRTGTTSIREALGHLDIKTYGFKEGAIDGHLKYWVEAIDAKFNGKGKMYGSSEFRKLLAGYSAITDIPAVLFVDELLEAFPDAKVVVSNRDLESWVVSMQKVVLHIMSWKSTWVLAPFDSYGIGVTFLGIWKCMEVLTKGDVFNEEKLRLGFKEHYGRVREVVPGDRRLEYRVQDGWGPLCKWLGEKEPEIAFPNVNDGPTTVKELAAVWRIMLGAVVTRISIYGGVFGALVWAVWAQRVPIADKLPYWPLKR